MDTAFLQRPGYPDLAYSRVMGFDPALPAVLFLGGFRSDRHGTKATRLGQFCADRGQSYVCFDYSGHGDSGGLFEEGTIESWRDDALAILDLITGPVVLVGSSMGGWIGLLLALARPVQVKAFVGIAAAPDFTRIITKRFTPQMQNDFALKNFAAVPNDYSPEPYLITRKLIESGERVCLLEGRHTLSIPIFLLQGKKDTEVDWTTPERIKACFPNAPVTITVVEDGDHSLSRPQDLSLIEQTLISACT